MTLSPLLFLLPSIISMSALIYGYAKKPLVPVLTYSFIADLAFFIACLFAVDASISGNIEGSWLRQAVSGFKYIIFVKPSSVAVGEMYSTFELLETIVMIVGTLSVIALIAETVIIIRKPADKDVEVENG